MSTARALARWMLRIGVSVGIVAYILTDVDRTDLWNAMRSVRSGPLLLGTIGYLIGQGLCAVKWAILGRSVGLRGSYARYARFYFIGMFFNLFGLSTLGGDVIRALYLAGGRRQLLALNSVVFDRLSGLALLMAIGAVAMAAFPWYGLPWALEAAVVAGGLAMLIGWWMCPRIVRLLPETNRLRRQVEDDLGPFWRDRRMLLVTSALTVTCHFLQTGVQYVLVRAAGATVPFTYCLVFHPLLSLMIALPVSLGGFGVREGGYLYFLTHIHIDDSIAVTTGLLWLAVTVVGGLVGGALFLATGAELPRLRRPERAAA